MILKELAYAKINLFLNITGRRDDGYHEIQSIMQTVSMADTLTMELADGEPALHVTCTDPSLPTDDGNLAVRAIHAYYEAAGLEEQTISLAIDKKIPVAAGLAGGSADASAVLRMLNRAHDDLLSDAALVKVAAALGADVPFCLHGGTVLCQGIGEKMTACPAIPDCFLVVAAGDEQSATGAAYAAADAAHQNGFPDRQEAYSSLVLAVADHKIDGISQNVFNVFEDVLLPRLKSSREIRRILADRGASCALMSGSGPAVFGIFQEERPATTAREILQAFGCKASVCTPVKY